jgi:hypothetical protein
VVRRALIAAALALAAPAGATQPGWPALHDVAGVAADDALNLRATPGMDGAVVGALPPDARGVEVIRPDADGAWGLVNHGEGTAWASLAFLARRPGQWLGAFPRVSACFGTEPFWTLTADPGGALGWATPEGTAEGRETARLGSAARRDRHALLGRIDGREVTAVIAAQACGDGMSDREYGLAVDLVRGDDLLSGCCTLAR